ncbi:unnamed protein product [Danaus chrysippus]|uniref:(African queen) hypothetical protein n=1 Tax=Danaus chrysippus TaxID=151541 RepID=A0A8J2QWS7_9NEOP|nr:unnamed protein product [Danaus chrysippus]
MHVTLVTEIRRACSSLNVPRVTERRASRQSPVATRQTAHGSRLTAHGSRPERFHSPRPDPDTMCNSKVKVLYRCDPDVKISHTHTMYTFNTMSEIRSLDVNLHPDL